MSQFYDHIRNPRIPYNDADTHVCKAIGTIVLRFIKTECSG